MRIFNVIATSFPELPPLTTLFYDEKTTTVTVHHKGDDRLGEWRQPSKAVRYCAKPSGKAPPPSAHLRLFWQKNIKFYFRTKHRMLKNTLAVS